MPDFDPAEFEMQSSAFEPPFEDDAGSDYTVLLDAMRKAGTDGVTDGLVPLSAMIARLEHAQSQFEQAAAKFDLAAHRSFWDRIKEWSAVGLVGLALMITGALFVRWAKEPKIVEHHYGCTGAWSAKTQTCKGKWVPLKEVGG